MILVGGLRRCEKHTHIRFYPIPVLAVLERTWDGGGKAGLAELGRAAVNSP